MNDEAKQANLIIILQTNHKIALIKRRIKTNQRMFDQTIKLKSKQVLKFHKHLIKINL